MLGFKVSVKRITQNLKVKQLFTFDIFNIPLVGKSYCKGYSVIGEVFRQKSSMNHNVAIDLTTLTLQATQGGSGGGGIC